MLRRNGMGVFEGIWVREGWRGRIEKKGRRVRSRVGEGPWEGGG